MMRNKWTKIPCVMNWTVHNADLKQKMSGQFDIQWARGSTKGQTDRIDVGVDHKLNYESRFEIPCTMYLSKQDSTVRAKILKIALRRFTDEKNHKVYGKLTLDLGKYYQKDTIKEKIEMESGRSIAPVLESTFQMIQTGKVADVGNVDEHDISFVGDTQDKMKTALDEWDITEIGRGGASSVDSDESDDGKHRKGKKKSKSKSKSKNKDKDKSKDKKHSKHHKHDKKDKNDKKSDRSKNESKQQNETTPVASTTNTSTPSVPIFKKESPDYSDIITSIVSRIWKMQDPATYIDDDETIPFPPPVFPLFSALLYAHVFDDNDNSENINKFVDLYENAILSERFTSRDRFLTDLLLILLAKRQENPDYFIERMKRCLDKSFDNYIISILQKFDVLINRFSTAKFEMEPLLSDLKQVFNGVKCHFTFTPGINQLLMETFLTKLEYRMLCKLIANPSRFLFSNAILWNSLISAFIFDERIEMPLLREFVSCLIMANNIASDPKMKDEIAPNTSPELILFLMKNFHPDVLMPDQIETKKFSEEYNVRIRNDDAPEIKSPHVIGLDIADNGTNLDKWNKGGISDEDRLQFPFLNKYKQ